MIIHTNVGLKGSNKICDVPDLEQTWYDENLFTNIISLAHTAEKYWVKYDSGEERGLIVHLLNKGFATPPSYLYTSWYESRRQQEFSSVGGDKL
jgi:hypothetical protein